MDDLETRVATKLREALDVCIDDGDGAIHTKGLAQVVIAAVREWDKEQASAAVRAEHEGNRTIEGRGWKQLSGFKTNDGWTNL